LPFFSAAVAGSVFPLYALIFSKVIMILTLNGDDPSAIAPGPVQGANLYAFLFVVLGIASLFSFFLQVASFEVAGERFTKRFRGQLFRSLLRQEVGFYDEEEHSMGALTSRLAIDAANVNEMVTKVWGDVTQVIVTAITGMLYEYIVCQIKYSVTNSHDVFRFNYCFCLWLDFDLYHSSYGSIHFGCCIL
jgi:ABC-type multidrug transport system fused ATPase/permease subunit